MCGLTIKLRNGREEALFCCSCCHKSKAQDQEYVYSFLHFFLLLLFLCKYIYFVLYKTFRYTKAANDYLCRDIQNVFQSQVMAE